MIPLAVHVVVPFPPESSDAHIDLLITAGHWAPNDKSRLQPPPMLNGYIELWYSQAVTCDPPSIAHREFHAAGRSIEAGRTDRHN